MSVRTDIIRLADLVKVVGRTWFDHTECRQEVALQFSIH